MDNLIEMREFLRVQMKISIDFWLRHSLDEEDGGIYPALDQQGQVFSCSKTISSQGASAYCFANLCNIYGEEDQWRKVSKSCLKSIEDAQGSLKKSDAKGNFFYSLGNAEYYEISEKQKYIDRARNAFENFVEAVFGSEQEGKEPHTSNLGEVSNLLSLSSYLRQIDPANFEEYDDVAKSCVARILDFHLDTEMECTLDNVTLRRAPHLENSEEREVCTEHVFECALALMGEAGFKNDEDLSEVAFNVLRFILEDAWDEECSGFFNKIDCKSLPVRDVDSEIKLCKTHCLAMVACIIAYQMSEDEDFLSWFSKVINYCDALFVDEEYGEWFSYLSREGRPAISPYKGDFVAGPFYLMDALVETERALTAIIDDED